MTRIKLVIFTHLLIKFEIKQLKQFYSLLNEHIILQFYNQ